MVPIPRPEPVNDPLPLPLPFPLPLLLLLLLLLPELEACASGGMAGIANLFRGDVGSVGILNGAAVGLSPPSLLDADAPTPGSTGPGRVRGGDDSPREEKEGASWFNG